MEESNRLGHNRTGIAASPLHDELPVTAGAEAIENREQPEALLLAEVRREYINEADALGTIPPPPTMKGMAKAGAGALKNTRVHVFLDKIAERLAFERGGTRIYDALLVKVLALGEGTPVRVERVKQIRNQEADHARLLEETITMMGADATAQTPCADVVGVQAMGLMQSVTDPRTTLSQSLNTVLAAELIDVASWDLLARLARSMGQEDVATRFEEALKHENEHLATISGWYEELVMSESKLVS
jgi:ferritin-like metal-binding protein YciE